MAFSRIPKALAIPAEATAVYTFFQFQLCPAGPPALTMRHVGDGTPAYKRAKFNADNANRTRSGGGTSEAKMRQALVADAKLVADHCVVKWENVVEDGAPEPSPCTPAKVHEFLCAILDADEGDAIYLAFRSWAADADNFRPMPTGDATELGKA